MALPDSETLQRSAPGSPTWVRATVLARSFLGIAASSRAQLMARRLTENASRFTSGIPISQPQLSGGSFVMDFRIKQTVTAGRFKAELERVAVRGIEFGRVEVVDLQRIQRGELQTAVAPAERQRVSVEAEESRKEQQRTPGDLVRGFVNTAKFLRGVGVVVVVGAILWVGFPFIQAGARAARARRRTGGKADGA